MRAAVLHIAAKAPEDQQSEAHQGDQVGDIVRSRRVVLEADMSRRRHDHHEVGCDAIRAISPVDLPVGEVAHLHQHRHTDLGDIEAEALVAHLVVADGDRVERNWIDDSHRYHDVDSSTGGHWRDADATVDVDLHVDALPLGGPIVGGHRGPLIGVLEPAGSKLEVTLALVARTAGDHHWLHGHRHDDVGLRHAINVPRATLGDQLEVTASLRLRFRGLGEHHQILDAHLLHHRHADCRVVVRVTKFPHRVRAALAHRRRREEVVGRGARGLEEQSFLTGDAAVGPVRQQHEGHRGSVFAVLAVVLPQGATTTQAGVRVVPQASHRVNQTLVLAICRSALIAREVVSRPAIAVCVGLAGNCDVDGVPPANAPRVRALAVLRREPSAWHLMEEEQLDNAGDRHNDDRSGCADN